jgi:hypothetical protein
MSHHIFGDRHIIVDLPIVHLELQPDKVGQYCRRSGLCLYWLGFLAWSCSDNGEPAGCIRERISTSSISSLRDNIWACVELAGVIKSQMEIDDRLTFPDGTRQKYPGGEHIDLVRK